MLRGARIVLAGFPHHVMQRGNNRQDVFFVDADREVCLRLLDAAYTVAAVRYIECNPVRAKITRMPWTYRWSSAAAHTGGLVPADILDLAAWDQVVNGLNWKERLTQPEDDDTTAASRLNTQTGRPLASDSFLSKLEHKPNRRLRPLPIGRPQKQQQRAKDAK